MASGVIKNIGGIVNGAINESALTGSGLVKNGACTLSKSGNVVQLTLDLKKSSGSNPYQLMGLIPDGFRPHNQITMLSGDGSATGQSLGTLATSGNLTLYIGTAGYIQGSTTYIAD